MGESPGTHRIEDWSPAQSGHFGVKSPTFGNQSLDYPAHILVIVRITLSLLLSTLPLAENSLVLDCLILCDFFTIGINNNLCSVCNLSGWVQTRTSADVLSGILTYI